MTKQKNALAAPPDPAKEKTTWGAVCKQVGFADNLYRTCREKLGRDFEPSNPFGGYNERFDDDDDGDDIDIDRELRRQALPVPPPPPEDWKPEPEGLMDQLMDGSLVKKVALYGGGALLAWYLWDRFKATKTASTAAIGPSAGAAALPTLSALPQAVVSNNAPTTVEIPASLRS